MTEVEFRQIHRITVKLDEALSDALMKASKMEYRHPREQAGFLIRWALEQHGYLSPIELPSNEPDGLEVNVQRGMSG